MHWGSINGGKCRNKQSIDYSKLVEDGNLIQQKTAIDNAKNSLLFVGLYEFVQAPSLTRQAKMIQQTL